MHTNWDQITFSSSASNDHRPTGGRKVRIAIVSSFVVTSAQSAKNAPRVTMLDHLVNKACYADLWGYDFIMNTTYGFDRKDSEMAHWLNFGTWHRVPHMQAALAKYDWVLYTDVDWVVQDLGYPLEGFLREFDLYNKDVHVFVPTESHLFTFSAYVVFIRNSPFGRRLLENWNDMAHGLCPNGNFPTVPGTYDWGITDQPGLWYSLMKTHMDFYPNATTPEFKRSVIHCNNETGLLQTKRFLGPELNIYMKKVGYKLGSQGMHLKNLSDNQVIAWSTVTEENRGGLGIQQTFGGSANRDFPHAFAVHKKKDFNARMMDDLDTCKNIRGCYAEYDVSGVLQIGCGRKPNTTVPA